MKRIRILAFILSMCFVSVAWGQKVKCPASVNWTEFHTIDMMRWNPCEKVLNVNNVGSLSLKWSYTTGGGVYSSPAVANGVVYVNGGTNCGQECFEDAVYALNAGTGALLWSYTTGGPGPVYSSPAVANGVVYVGSEDNNVYALNAKTGALLWNYTTGNSIDSSPAVANGVVYVGGGNDVYALNASSGALLWSYATNGAVESSPAVVNGVVYVGSDDGNLYAFGLKKGRK
jgi:eukaryotic-like serine/threonine-protein kinase